MFILKDVLDPKMRDLEDTQLDTTKSRAELIYFHKSPALRDCSRNTLPNMDYNNVTQYLNLVTHRTDNFKQCKILLLSFEESISHDLGINLYPRLLIRHNLYHVGSCCKSFIQGLNTECNIKLC
jgi:hypothetical protein